MSRTDIAEKKTRRFLKSIARTAAFELEQLKEIPAAPSALDYFYNILEAVFVRNDPGDLLNSKGQQRKPIGIYCMMVPEELIYAAGALPVRLCAGCYASSQIGEDRVPRDGCPLVKSAMGFSIQKGLAVYDVCDTVIMPTTCDSKRKLGEELSAFQEVWMLEVPHIKEAEFSKRIWMEQMYALKSKLEAYAGNGRGKSKITTRKLGAAIGDSARAQSEIRRLLRLRQTEKRLIWGRQATAVVNSYAYAPAARWTDALIKLNDQLEQRAQASASVADGQRPRLFIAGSPPIFPNLKIPTLAEEMGGIVVADESCAGDRYLYDPVGSTEIGLRNQMAAIASRYMAPCVCPSFAPNDDRLVLIRRMVKEFAVDGILYHVLKGCVIYDFEVRRVEDALKELGVPLLRIETDYNPEDVEQLRTRIEAFIEMLKSKKRKLRS
jgi:benzoyl-CoA reductase/2-hydroxyglutaryl-CoA dehydratase subunit BcrC/BadD/HgdB